MNCGFLAPAKNTIELWPGEFAAKICFGLSRLDDKKLNWQDDFLEVSDNGIYIIKYIIYYIIQYIYVRLYTYLKIKIHHVYLTIPTELLFELLAKTRLANASIWEGWMPMCPHITYLEATAVCKMLESTGTPVIDMMTLKIRVLKNLKLLLFFQTNFLNDMNKASVHQISDPVLKNRCIKRTPSTWSISTHTWPSREKTSAIQEAWHPQFMSKRVGFTWLSKPFPHKLWRYHADLEYSEGVFTCRIWACRIFSPHLTSQNGAFKLVHRDFHTFSLAFWSCTISAHVDIDEHPLECWGWSPGEVVSELLGQMVMNNGDLPWYKVKVTLNTSKNI